MQKQTTHLKAEALLRYFLGTDDYIDTLIKCRGTEVNIVTSDQDLYEALGSLQEYDNFRLNKLIKLLEVTTILPHSESGEEKRILTHQRVEQLRKIALKNN